MGPLTSKWGVCHEVLGWQDSRGRGAWEGSQGLGVCLACSPGEGVYEAGSPQALAVRKATQSEKQPPLCPGHCPPSELATGVSRGPQDGEVSYGNCVIHMVVLDTRSPGEPDSVTC